MKTNQQPMNIVTTCTEWRNRFVALGLLLSSMFAAASDVAKNKPKPDWSPADMPAQKGRFFVVTGGTSGMGYEDAKALAAAGAHVVIAARSAQRGQEAIERIKQEFPDAKLQFEAFDLADLASVRALGKRLNETLPQLDGLINNAAVMALPERAESPAGHEAQFAINYAGHFVLTAELLPLLRKSDSPRVVTLSSVAALRGGINFDDLQSTKVYDPYLEPHCWPTQEYLINCQ